MSIDPIPERANSKEIDAAWFNKIKEFIEAYLERMGQPIKYSYSFDDSSFAVASTTANKTIITLEAMEMVNFILLKHSTAFSGGSISALTASIGFTGFEDKVLLPFDLTATPSGTLFKVNNYGTPEDMGASNDLKIFLEATGDDLDQLTQGGIDIWLIKSKLPA